MTEKQRLVAFKGYVIKGWEIRRGFRVEVQYLEFGFRLRCGMKKLLVLQLSLFIYSNSLKEKTMKEKVGVPAFSFFSFHSSPFETPSSSNSKVCFKTSSHPEHCPILGSSSSSSEEIHILSDFSSSITHIFFSLFYVWVWAESLFLRMKSSALVLCGFVVILQCVCVCVCLFFPVSMYLCGRVRVCHSFSV